MTDSPLQTVEFASTDNLDQMDRDILHDFIVDILQYNPRDVWLSDRSCLSDFFANRGEIENAIDTINRLYHLDLHYTTGLLILTILQEIQNRIKDKAENEDQIRSQ